MVDAGGLAEYAVCFFGRAGDLLWRFSDGEALRTGFGDFEMTGELLRRGAIGLVISLDRNFFRGQTEPKC